LQLPPSAAALAPLSMSEEKLVLVLEIDGVVQTVPFIAHNGKTIFLVEIDLFPHDKPVSQRGALRAIRVTKADLVGEAGG
jgi:hypothetical protein